FHQLGHSSRVLRHGKKKTECIRLISLILLSDYSGAEDIMYKLLPRGPRIRNEEVVYTKDFSILIAVWVIFLVLHIVKTYTSTCSTTYWILNLLQVPVAVGVSAYEAVCLYNGTRVIMSSGKEVITVYMGDRVVMSSGEEVITWKVHQLILYCCCGFLAGIVGGLLGLHGGFILVPLFLQLGILPQVSSTTANFMMIFSSSMSVIQYYLLGHFPVPYGGVGIADAVQRIKEGQYMGFDNICAYKP
ncbi:hypothetical protein KY284_012234, partial [Solanum tuberosum]